MKDLAFDILSAKFGETHVFYLGQAGFVFKSKKGTLLAVDIYLSNCVERVEGHVGYKRLLPALLAPDALKFDYIIATHPHFDHFDMDAIPVLMANGHTRLLASVHCEREVQRLMMSNQNITYVKVGDKVTADDIETECVFCDHGAGAPDAVGLVITIDSKKIYIAGDTCLRMDEAQRLKEKGPFHIMIAPINGAFGNLNEWECVALSKLLRPKLTIPSHYGMFASHGGDPGLFMSHMEGELPDQEYLLMAVGEGLAF